MKRPPTQTRLALVALAAGLLLAPAPARCTYRDGVRNWNFRQTPVLLHGATLGAGTALEARERSRRLGFALLDDGDPARGGMPAIPLHEGRLNWTLEAGGAFATLDTRAFTPILAAVHRRAGEADVAGGDPSLGHPNHVTRLVGVIGIVGDVGSAVYQLERMPPFDEGRSPIRFGRTATRYDLDAWAADARVPGGSFVQLIAPKNATSPCAAWRGAGTGRWIGLVFESGDITATAAWFTSHDVPFRWSGWTLALDPETTGGVYMEFVAEGARPVL